MAGGGPILLSSSLCTQGSSCVLHKGQPPTAGRKAGKGLTPSPRERFYDCSRKRKAGPRRHQPSQPARLAIGEPATFALGSHFDEAATLRSHAAVLLPVATKLQHAKIEKGCVIVLGNGGIRIERPLESSRSTDEKTSFERNAVVPTCTAPARGSIEQASQRTHV